MSGVHLSLFYLYSLLLESCYQNKILPVSMIYDSDDDLYTPSTNDEHIVADSVRVGVMRPRTIPITRPSIHDKHANSNHGPSDRYHLFVLLLHNNTKIAK